MTLTTFRKLCLLFLTANIVTIAVNAQIEFGIKGGFNSAEILTSTTQGVNVNGNPMSIRNFPKTDFHAGFLVSIPLTKKFTLQPEIDYSQQGAQGNPSGGYLVSATEKYKFNYFNVPILLQYKLPFGFYAETGPQVGYLVSASIVESIVGASVTNTYHVKSQYKSTDFSWAFGGGYISPINLGLDIRYNLGLSNINNASASSTQTAPVQEGTIRNSVLQIGVFYLFGKLRNPPPAEEVK